jgi:hypothetical protein
MHRKLPLVLGISLAAACSASSAPDNAAGSVKQAPTAKPAAKAEAVASPKVEAEAKAEAGATPEAEANAGAAVDAAAGADTPTLEAGKRKPGTALNGPKCNKVTPQTCEDAARQKTCKCAVGLSFKMYDCGCYTEGAAGVPGNPGETKTPTD